jgi:hypothetical protein
MDSDFNILQLSEIDYEKPIKANKSIKSKYKSDTPLYKALYNNERKRNHGPAKTGMLDPKRNVSITEPGFDSLNDPFDRKNSGNLLKMEVRASMTPDLISALNKLQNKFNFSKNNNLLSEIRDNDLFIVDDDEE